MPGEEAPNIPPEDEPPADVPLEPGVETLFSEIKRRVWASGGPMGQDNPEAEVLGEVLHEDNEVYYHMRGLDGHDY
jgi:hypothetical protein